MTNNTINLYFGDDLSLYREIPVSVNEFITNPHYIGEYTKNGANVFPFWKDVLNTIFRPDYKKRCIVASTDYNTGKTEFCNIALAYILYLFMCLKNPQEFFKFIETDTMLITLCDPDSIQYNYIFEIIRKSMWFQVHGVLNINENNFIESYKAFDNNIILQKVQCEDDMLGKQVVSGSFIWTIREDTEDIFNTYQAFSARIQSRSCINGTLYGFVFVDIERDFGRAPREYGWHCPNDLVTIIDDSSYDTRITPDVMGGVRYKERFGVF